MARLGAAFGAVTAGVVAVGIAGCGGSSNVAVRTTPPGPTATTSATTPATTSPSGTPSGAHRPTAVVQPSKGLVDGQLVTVTASGFSPNQSLVVTECANKGTKTTSGDCNLEALVSLPVGASGSGTVKLRVAKGPFGTNGIVCGPSQRCLVSVTQPTPTPQEESDVAITFR